MHLGERYTGARIHLIMIGSREKCEILNYMERVILFGAEEVPQGRYA